nr:GGDEF domain-containing protein [Bacilli bacterium]
MNSVQKNEKELLRLRALNNLLKSIRDKIDTAELLEAIKMTVTDLLTVDRLGLLVAEPKGKFCIIHEYVTKDFLPFCPPGSVMAIENSAIEWVFRENRYHYNPDLSIKQQFEEDAFLHADGIFSIVRIPFFHAGTAYGVMTVKSTNPHHFSEEDIDFLIELADHVSASLYYAKVLMEFKLMSYTDPLTGLFNRRALHQITDQSSLIQFMDDLLIHYDFGEDIHSLAVLLIDLDGFKDFNDRHGHLQGDQRLQTVAKILRYATPGHQLIFRFGGDEFVILLPNANEIIAHNTAAHIRQAGLKLADQTNEPIYMSIGIHNDIWSELSFLLAKADAMMYSNKRYRSTGEMHSL